MNKILLKDKIMFVKIALNTSSRAILLKIYSEAQVQRLKNPRISNTSDFCKPHTNTRVDSPSTYTWANLSAPVKPEPHRSGLGAQSDSFLIQGKTEILNIATTNDYKIPNLTSIKQKGIYPMVDAVVLTKENSLKSEFIVNSGAEMHHLLLAYNRARNAMVHNDGELVHDSEFRRFVLNDPVVFQIIGGETTIIRSTYGIDSNGIVSFDIDEYDKSLPLIIVPTIGEIDEFADYNKRYEQNIQKFNKYELEEFVLQTVDNP